MSMRTLLRNIRTGDYVLSFESWTSAPGEAFDFSTIDQALDLVHRRGLRDMELVLADDAGPPTRVPVAKLDSTFIYAHGHGALASRRNQV